MSQTVTLHFIHRLLSTARIAVLILLCCLSLSRFAVAQCDQDFPSAASLLAARTAIESGATDVALSPGGCWRHQRDFSEINFFTPGVNKEVTSFDSQPFIVWDHSFYRIVADDALQRAGAQSAGTRDNDLDGFNEWRAKIERLLESFDGVTPTSLWIQIETTEYDPGSQMPFRRLTKTYSGSGTMRVKLEEGLGTLRVVSEYDAPALVESKAQAMAFPGGLLTEAQAQIAPVSVPCPAGLEAEVLSMLPFSAGNGGRCLHDLGLKAQAGVIFEMPKRKFSIGCARGATGWQAQIDAVAAADPLLTITLNINLDVWANRSRHESILFHELMHTAFPDHAAPLVGQMTKEERDKRWREFDRVGSCNSLCYNPDATQCECATCLSKKNCDAPCTSFKACFSTQKGGFCPCSNPNATPPIMPRWYASFTECVTECPRGQGCFGVQCRQEQNACK